MKTYTDNQLKAESHSGFLVVHSPWQQRVQALAKVKGVEVV